MYFTETSRILNNISYTVCLNICHVVQRCTGTFLFLIFFLSMTVIIQFQNIFNCIINYFAFVQKSIVLSSGNYNFKLLSILEIYLHKLKLTSCSNNHSQKIRICKSMYIFSAFTLIKSREFCFIFSKKPGNL